MFKRIGPNVYLSFPFLLLIFLLIMSTVVLKPVSKTQAENSQEIDYLKLGYFDPYFNIYGQTNFNDLVANLDYSYNKAFAGTNNSEVARALAQTSLNHVVRYKYMNGSDYDLQKAIYLIDSLANTHDYWDYENLKKNGWGIRNNTRNWTAIVASYNLGLAAWLVWDDLNTEQQKEILQILKKDLNTFIIDDEEGLYKVGSSKIKDGSDHFPDFIGGKEINEENFKYFIDALNFPYTYPKSGYWQDTKAEEHAVQASFLSLIDNMFKKDSIFTENDPLYLRIQQSYNSLREAVELFGFHSITNQQQGIDITNTTTVTYSYPYAHSAWEGEKGIISDAINTEQIRVTFNSTDEVSTSISPYSSKILFSSSRDNNNDIYIKRLNGKEVRLTNSDSSETEPSWSPDGSMITFVSNRDGNEEIYVMKSNGTDQVRLTNSDSSETEPSWSPDGSIIMFSSDREENNEIYLLSKREAFGRNKDGDLIWTRTVFNNYSLNAHYYSPNLTYSLATLGHLSNAAFFYKLATENASNEAIPEQITHHTIDLWLDARNHINTPQVIPNYINSQSPYYYEWKRGTVDYYNNDDWKANAYWFTDAIIGTRLFFMDPLFSIGKDISQIKSELESFETTMLANKANLATTNASSYPIYPHTSKQPISSLSGVMLNRIPFYKNYGDPGFDWLINSRSSWSFAYLYLKEKEEELSLEPVEVQEDHLLITPKYIFLPNITKDYFHWTIPFIVQNLDSDNHANVRIKFYNRDNGKLLGITNAFIAPGASASFNPKKYPFLPTGFKGSVKIESINGVQIAAIANCHNLKSDTAQSMSYRGFLEGDRKLFFPNITKKYYKWTTTFSVQNISDEEAEIVIKFIKKGQNSPSLMINESIKPYSSKGINPGNYSELENGWQGSVIVESLNDKEIIGVVNQHHELGGAMSYRGMFAKEASSNVYLPNITKQYFKWTTPFIIQNIDEEEAIVTVKFYDNDQDETYFIKDMKIKPGTALGINPDIIDKLSSNWQGSVEVTANNGKKIIGVVNQHNLNGITMSYNGTNEGGLFNYLPNINTRNSNWSSTFSIKNLSMNNIEVSINFLNKNGNNSIETLQFEIAPKAMIGINTKKYIPEGFKGSVVILSGQGDIYTTVNQQREQRDIINDGMSYDSYFIK